MSFTGSCAVWVVAAGDFQATNYPGTQSGYDSAVLAAGSNGTVWVYNGSGSISVGTVPAGVVVHWVESGTETIYGTSAVVNVGGTDRLTIDSSGASVAGTVSGTTLTVSGSASAASVSASGAVSGATLSISGTATVSALSATNTVSAATVTASSSLTGPKVLETYGIVFADDYATLQAALDATPSGGTLQLSEGTYSPATTPSFTGGLERDNATEGNVTIRGAGSLGTTLYLNSASYNNTDCIINRGGGLTLENLVIRGCGTSGTGRGVAILDQNAAAGTVNMAYCTFRRLEIYDTPNYGIEFDSSNGGMPWDNSLYDVAIYDVVSGGCLHYGYQGVSTVGPRCYGCKFDGNGVSFGTYGTDSLDKGSVHLENAIYASFYQCSWQPIPHTPSLSVNGGGSILLDGCYMEAGPSSDGGKYWITTAGNVAGLTVRNTQILRPDYTVAPRLFKSGSTSSNVWLNLENILAQCTGGAPAGGNDIVLGATADRLRLVNVDQQNTSSGVHQEWSYTDNHAVSIEFGQWPYPRLSLPRVNGTGSITARKGDVVYDYSSDTVQIYNGTAWKTLTWT